jgi:Rrf2 family nitric oxide-sensitive transcriptional repressor
MVECFDGEHDRCVLTPVCDLKNVLQRATAAYLEVLDEVSLADLIRDGGQLRQRMGIGEMPIRLQPAAKAG